MVALFCFVLFGGRQAGTQPLALTRITVTPLRTGNNVPVSVVLNGDDYVNDGVTNC